MNKYHLFNQLNEAIQAYHSGKLDDAEDIFKQILAIQPKEPKALHLLGCIYKERGELKSAINLIKQSISIDDSDPFPFLNLGKILYATGQNEKAALMFRNSLQRNQQIAESWFCFGNALRDANKTNAAIRAYCNCMNLDCSNPGVASSLGALLTQLEGQNEAKKILDEVLSSYSGDVNYLISLGQMFQKEGETHLAIETYQSALNIKSNLPEAYYYLGLSYQKSGNVKCAIASFRNAIVIKPSFIDAYSALAKLLSSQGDYRGSIEISRDALDIDENNSLIAGSLGLNFFRAGLVESSISYYSARLAKQFCVVSAYYLFRALDQRIPQKINTDFNIASSFCSSAMKYMNVENILAFGDSHIRVFSGLEEIETHYVGPATAYNLTSGKSSSGGSQMVWSRLNKVRGKKSSTAVLLGFGEIDCRNHIIKQCYMQRISIHESASRVVESYMQFIRQILDADFKVIIYGCYGSGSHFNAVGSEAERNLAASEVNRLLQQNCQSISVPFFTLNAQFVDEYGLTRKYLMQDDAHLPEMGNAGIEIRSILMAKLLDSCKRIYTDSSLINSNLGYVWNNTFCNVGVVNLGVSDQSTFSWNPTGQVKMQKPAKIISSLYFDMGSQYVVNGFSLSFSDSIPFSSCPFSFNLDGHKLDIGRVIFQECRLEVVLDKYLARYIEIVAPPLATQFLCRITQVVPLVDTAIL